MTTISAADISYIPNPHRLGQAGTLSDAIALVSGSACPHRLNPVDRYRRTFTCTASALDLGDCALMYVQYGFDVAIEVGCVDDYFLVKSTFAGEGYLRSGQRSVVTSPSCIAITCPGEQTEIGMTAECRHLTARISRQALERNLVEKLGRRLKDDLRFDLQISVESTFGQGWQGLLTHICQLSARAPGILEAPDMRRQYARTMIEMLLSQAPHNYSAALRSAQDYAIPWYVKRAREYIRNHLPAIRSVAEIAASVGTSTRTLQSGFRQAYGKTPAEYLRCARVQALHDQLLSAQPTESVTGLMESLGIVNFGRYAAYYRRMIGERPSTTRRRAMGVDCSRQHI
ncbi:MAG: AraC family transcriptional regulator [Proteobacteria bacterium]|nr:AraC family transcriptional regulator [Pseudomonadota bacterium]